MGNARRQANRIVLAVTVDDLRARAESAIERDEGFIYDVAGETGQMVGNVKHMRWFVEAVANWLIDNTGRWSRLPHFGN